MQPANSETAYRISFFGDEVESISHFDPLTGEIYARLDNLVIWPGDRVRDLDADGRARRRRHPPRARGAGAEVRGAGQAARGAPAAPAHRVRPGDDARSSASAPGSRTTRGILEGRPQGSHPFTLLDYFPDDFVVFVDESHQTVPQLGGMYEGDRSRKQTLVDFGFRLPSALDNRPLRFDEFLQQGAAARLRLGDAGPVRAPPLEGGRRAADPADVRRRPRGRAARDEEPDRRPAERDPAPRGGRRARAGHDADEEDGRGPDRLPARGGREGALPPLGDRHARADPDHPRAPARRVRRARRRQPAPRGARPARGLAGRGARRRQGGLPARQDGADPDDRPRRPQRQREGAPLRRPDDRGDPGRARRDEPPPREAARVQRGARDHARSR